MDTILEHIFIRKVNQWISEFELVSTLAGLVRTTGQLLCIHSIYELKKTNQIFNKTSNRTIIYLQYPISIMMTSKKLKIKSKNEKLLSCTQLVSKI